MAAVVRMVNELHLVAQELEPLVFPTLHFLNIIERGMSVYRESSRPEENSTANYLYLCSSHADRHLHHGLDWKISYSRAAPGGRGVVMKSERYV